MSRTHDKCLKESRNTIKPHNISKIRFKENNLTARKDMKDVIKNIENLLKLDAKKNVIKLNDLSTSLPPNLIKRVSNIIPLWNVVGENYEEENERQIVGEEEYLFKKEEFNESTCSIIEQLEVNFHHFEIKIENEEKKKAKVDGSSGKNWLSDYVCGKRKERIKWNSKLYPADTDVTDKKITEQAEILMNSASLRFTEWINSITTNTDTNLSKEYLLSLFQVNSGSKILGTIQIDPKIMGAVPRKVASTWNMPENSIDLKLAKKIKQTMDQVPKKIIKKAFGRTLPFNMRPWIPTDAYTLIKPNFPDEIRKFKVLFEGISHLKSIREFIQHCKTDNHIERPEYLVETGCFKTEKLTETEGLVIPLYELLNCKY